jgi:hypothetical protein
MEITRDSNYYNVQCMCRKAVQTETYSILNSAADGFDRPVHASAAITDSVGALVGFEDG